MTEEEFAEVCAEIADSTNWAELDAPTKHDTRLLAEFAKVVLANLDGKVLRHALAVVPNWKPSKAEMCREAKQRASRLAANVFKVYWGVRQSPSMREALELAYWAYYDISEATGGKKKGEPVSPGGPRFTEIVQTLRAWRDGRHKVRFPIVVSGKLRFPVFSFSP